MWLRGSGTVTRTSREIFSLAAHFLPRNKSPASTVVEFWNIQGRDRNRPFPRLKKCGAFQLTIREQITFQTCRETRQRRIPPFMLQKTVLVTSNTRGTRAGFLQRKNNPVAIFNFYPRFLSRRAWALSDAQSKYFFTQRIGPALHAWEPRGAALRAHCEGRLLKRLTNGIKIALEISKRKFTPQRPRDFCFFSRGRPRCARWFQARRVSTDFYLH